MDIFTAAVIGIHIGSVHVPVKDYQNNINPGIYARNETGQQIGVYYNTYKRPTFYIGQEVKVWQSFSIAGAIATGYQNTCQPRAYRVGMGPYIYVDDPDVYCGGISARKYNFIGAVIYTPSVKVFGATPRIWFSPSVNGRSSSIFHLTLEH